MMASYKEFLEKNYQKNTNEVITLITKARDELSNEVKELEKIASKPKSKNKS